MRNAIVVATCPYEVRNSDGTTSILNSRFMCKSELEDLICRVIARGNVVLASRIKLVHRIKIKEICEYMMSILGGKGASSGLIKETLKQALIDLEIDVRDLCTISPEQIMEVKNSFQNNAGKRKR